MDIERNSTTVHSIVSAEPHISLPRKMVPFTVLIIPTAINGLVIFLTIKHRQFHQCYMYIRAASSFIDILYVWGNIVTNIIGNFWPQPNLFRSLCILDNLGKGMYFCRIQLMTLIAMERYFYFCKPMIYETLFNSKTIIIASSIMFTMSQSYAILTEVFVHRERHPVLPTCQLKNDIHFKFQIAVFLLPHLLAVCFSIFQIWRLLHGINKQTRILPVSLSLNSEPKLRMKAVSKAFR